MPFRHINSQDDETKLMLARAFDDAWSRFVGHEGDAADSDVNRAQLAACIVRTAKAGEQDEAVLAESGLIWLRVLAETARIGHQKHNAPDIASDLVPAEPMQDVQAFGPETVSAMSTALDLCLDVLPFGIPSDTSRVLSASILADASRGERDPERMRRHALEALRTRQ